MAEDNNHVQGLYIREKQTKYSPIMNVGVSKQFIEYYNEHKDENGNLNIDFKKMKEAKATGITHYAEKNTWKKEENPL